jgi:hypothetical protein
MDLLPSCMNALRVLARQPDAPGRLRLAEIRINEYLGSGAAALHSLLERLAEAIRVEGQEHPSAGVRGGFLSFPRLKGRRNRSRPGRQLDHPRSALSATAPRCAACTAFIRCRQRSGSS